MSAWPFWILVPQLLVEAANQISDKQPLPFDPPPPHRPPSYECLSEELKDCCSIAASSTGSFLAYGLGTEVLPRMAQATGYGEPLDRNFIADFFDSEKLLVEEILRAAGYSERGPVVQRPLFNLELIKAWAHLLFSICKKKSLQAWSTSMTSLKEQMRRAAPMNRHPWLLGEAKGTPREALSGWTNTSLAMAKRRRSQISADGQQRHGSGILVTDGVD